MHLHTYYSPVAGIGPLCLVAIAWIAIRMTWDWVRRRRRKHPPLAVIAMLLLASMAYVGDCLLSGYNAIAFGSVDQWIGWQCLCGALECSLMVVVPLLAVLVASIPKPSRPSGTQVATVTTAASMGLVLVTGILSAIATGNASQVAGCLTAMVPQFDPHDPHEMAVMLSCGINCVLSCAIAAVTLLEVWRARKAETGKMTLTTGELDSGKDDAMGEDDPDATGMEVTREMVTPTTEQNATEGEA